MAFMRTDQFNDHTVVARSVDGGRSFQPWQDAGFQDIHIALGCRTKCCWSMAIITHHLE